MREPLSGALGKRNVFSGEIRVIPDHCLNFGDYDESSRTQHERRYVLILQGDETSNNDTCQALLVAPLSSRIENKRSWEDILTPSETPLTSPSIVKLQLLQPVSCRVLLDDGAFAGAIQDAVLDRLRVHLIDNPGIR
ncbi:MAG: type II toxin-antitoxin system PemK/MazF family toxin [Thermomicrobiales bacterium]